MATVVLYLQWRAGQLPGLTSSEKPKMAIPANLQWRAGQLPGLTRRSDQVQLAVHGRLQWRAGQLPGLTTSSLTSRALL